MLTIGADIKTVKAHPLLGYATLKLRLQSNETGAGREIMELGNVSIGRMVCG